MTLEEFSNEFDILFNNITSNQAPGLNEHEKSVFLTKAEKEIVKNHFTATSKGNNIGQGFDDSALRQADFSMLMKTFTCSSDDTGISTYEIICSNNTDEITKAENQLTFRNVQSSLVSDAATVIGTDSARTVTWDSNGYATVDQYSSTGVKYRILGWPFQNEGGTIERELVLVSEIIKIDPRSSIYSFPTDVFIAINETIVANNNKYLQVIPLRYDEYLRLMSKPFKRPLKNQAWRLINVGAGVKKYVEVIAGYNDTISSYTIRYIRAPKPIILADLEGLTIDGYTYTGETCELDPIIHQDILQRAVELAKVAWTATGNENLQAVMTAGQRSE